MVSRRAATLGLALVVSLAPTLRAMCYDSCLTPGVEDVEAPAERESCHQTDAHAPSSTESAPDSEDCSHGGDGPTRASRALVKSVDEPGQTDLFVAAGRLVVSVSLSAVSALGARPARPLASPSWLPVPLRL